MTAIRCPVASRTTSAPTWSCVRNRLKSHGQVPPLVDRCLWRSLRWRPEAPAAGPGRVVSIAEHAQQLRQELVEHPQRFDAAAGINARRAGAPEPQLLALAG